jgi:hypothetical protein
MSRSREIEAADRLEELIPDLRQLVADLRDGKGMAYARVYHFRRRVGQVVASLGSGYPGEVPES